MAKYEITGRIIEGNYQGVPRTSYAKVDYPTGERVSVEVGGVTYGRTVFERAVCRSNPQNGVVLARFVIVNGVQYEVASVNDANDGRALVTKTVYVVMTEVNGYRNIYGHVVYSDPRAAEAAARKARESGSWDYVYMTEWPLV